MNTVQNKTIVIFGSSKPKPDSPNYLQACELGKTIAAAGYTIANGGYSGIMAATAHAARQAHGQTIGVTCDVFKRSVANPFIDKEIRTKNLSERLNTLIELGDAFIVLPGSTGTLLELVTCWELMSKKFLKNAPLICLTDYWKPVIDTVVNSGETDGRCITFTDSLTHITQILSDYFNRPE